MANQTLVSFNGPQPPAVFNTTRQSNELSATYAKQVILFVEEQNNFDSEQQQHQQQQSYTSNAIVALMIAFWVLLIFLFVFCGCAQCFGCFRHKQWRASAGDRRRYGRERVEQEEEEEEEDRNRHGDQPVEICRRFPADFEAESLPSYTIVSGLPSYDDALEEFRKAGIVIAPSIPIIKIFDSETTKNPNIFTIEDALHDINMNTGGGSGGGLDNVSVGGSTTCTCGAGGIVGVTNTGLLNNNSATPTHNSMLSLSQTPSGTATQIIELTPEQLAKLSQKRLSLQITFNSAVRRNSRPRIDLYREANLNNHLRSRGVSNAGLEPFAAPIHRSSSTHSLSINEQNRMQQHLQHRGSLF